MSGRGILAGGAAGLLVVSGLAVVVGTASIERDLANRVVRVLEAADVNADVVVSGRDVTLRAAAPIAESVMDDLRDRHDPDFDVHSVKVVVTDDAAVAPATVPPPASPTTTTTTIAPETIPPPVTQPSTTTTEPAAPTVAVTVQFNSATGTITLAGNVFSIIEQAALLIPAQAAVGADKVVNELTITDGDTLVGDAHTAGLVRIVQLFGTDLVSASASVVAGVVTVTGVLASVDAAVQLEEAVAIGESQGVTFVIDITPPSSSQSEG